MNNAPDLNIFENAYAGQAPWDIGKPNQVFVDVANRITGSILDAGCGTGENALYFAGRDCKVTGIDFIEEAIIRAKRKAVERGLEVTFLVKDANLAREVEARPIVLSRSQAWLQSRLSACATLK